MQNEPSMVKRRLRPRVILVSQKNNNSLNQNLTQEEILSALRVPPSERSKQEIDTILNCVGKWPEFTKVINSDQERREICRRIECEEYRANTLVYKEGDHPDGWYLVFSGMCTFYTYAVNDSYQEQIPPLHLNRLQEYLGKDKFFRYRSKIMPKMGFGSSSLTSNNTRKETVYCDVPTVILRIDPRIFESTIDWCSRSFLEKKANLLAHIPQLQFLLELSDQDIYLRLAENMVERRFEAGTIIESSFADNILRTSSNLNSTSQQNSISINKSASNFFVYEEHGFLVIEEGQVSKERLVDFNEFKLTRLQIAAAEMPIRIPKGKHKVSIGKYGPKSMIPHPDMRGYVLHPFSIHVTEPVIAYELMPDDLSTLLLNTQIQQIKKITMDEPDDYEVIMRWKKKQESAQWKVYKKDCVREARKRGKMEKNVTNGQWVMRKAKIPKSLKDIGKYSSLIRKNYDDL